jgi:hypothetical protein
MDFRQSFHFHQKQQHGFKTYFLSARRQDEIKILGMPLIILTPKPKKDVIGRKVARVSTFSPAAQRKLQAQKTQ